MCQGLLSQCQEMESSFWLRAMDIRIPCWLQQSFEDSCIRIPCWLQQSFEDSWSTLAFGVEFLQLQGAPLVGHVCLSRARSTFLTPAAAPRIQIRRTAMQPETPAENSLLPDRRTRPR
jgi:hypothetical protein